MVWMVFLWSLMSWFDGMMCSDLLCGLWALW